MPQGASNEQGFQALTHTTCLTERRVLSLTMTSTDDGVGDDDDYRRGTVLWGKVEDVATPSAIAGPLAAIGTLSSTDNESEVCPCVKW